MLMLRGYLNGSLACLKCSNPKSPHDWLFQYYSGLPWTTQSNSAFQSFSILHLYYFITFLALLSEIAYCIYWISQKIHSDYSIRCPNIYLLIIICFSFKLESKFHKARTHFILSISSRYIFLAKDLQLCLGSSDTREECSQPGGWPI